MADDLFMNGYQAFIVLFATMIAVISVWSIIVVARSDCFRFKALWCLGCLVGFVGFGINWTRPNDIILLFGFTVPVFMVFKIIATGQVVVKTGFPVVSVVALVKSAGIRSRPSS